jgi:hypothetical protein
MSNNLRPTAQTYSLRPQSSRGFLPRRPHVRLTRTKTLDTLPWTAIRFTPRKLVS